MNFYEALAVLVLAAHLVWILWVILGWLVTRHRPLLAWLHVLSLVWGIIMEVGPWPCPLTLVEQRLLERAGIPPYPESFLVHYLEKIIYPDVPEAALTWGGSGACLFLLGIYGIRFWRSRQPRPPAPFKLP